MIEILEQVRHEIIKLIPSAIMSDITCFVFYDHHPRDEKNIDITICTKNGELQEFHQRDLLSSICLNSVSKPTDIKIVRNNNSEMFYLVAAGDELFIINSKQKLQILKKISNVDRYDVNDTACSGQSCLKVIRKDDAVPILFDSNFESLEDQGIFPSTPNVEDTLPILTELKRKLVEARYTLKCNEKTYSQYINLRQNVTLLSNQNLNPNSEVSAFKVDVKNFPGSLKFQTQEPWVKVCNKNIVIMFKVYNESNEPLQNIHMLLNSKNIPSIVYTTKLFSKLSKSPFWWESNNTLKAHQNYAIVAVLDLEEIKSSIISRIELNGSVSYKLLGNEYLMPFEDVVISSMESVGDQFDVLSCNEENDPNTIIAILATTVKTELCLRHIKTNEPKVSLLDLLCKHLQMEKLGKADNIIVYRKSPYHALNGSMIIFPDGESGGAVSVTVHTRSPTQVLSLLHYIYDAVPAKIVATTPKYRITAKTADLSHYDEEISSNHHINYTDYAASILNSTTKILEHLDRSMIRMSESKNPSVLSKVGSHIDLFAGGVADFKEFRDNVLNEAKKGKGCLLQVDSVESSAESDLMIIE